MTVAYNLGGLVRLTFDVKDEDGDLTNPSTATLTITQPDGTLAGGIVVDITPTNVGELVYDFTPTQTGRHDARWVTTGPVSSDVDTFTVEADGRMLVSVDEAIAHLKATQTITSDPDREQLQWLCLAATDAIERDLGRTLTRRTVIETHTGYSSAIVLQQTPVLSITSVVESGVTLTASDWLLDSATGILYRGATTGLRSYSAGALNVVVTYVAGYADPPRVARMAALNLVQSMYQQSQTAFHPVIDESGAEAFASAALPVLSQMPGYASLRAPGIA